MEPGNGLVPLLGGIAHRQNELAAWKGGVHGLKSVREAERRIPKDLRRMAEQNQASEISTGPIFDGYAFAGVDAPQNVVEIY
jgi:hypothetical protein